ncbi:BatA domain-containing protein [candidate division KSB1 bacterium]|nr:BatA domain-containing protein [candidate division KSB1 bacterium]
MSFLNPTILFGLAAASLPVLIHLFTRTKSKTVLFSSLNFLRELEQQAIKRVKLREILLLILRTLIIIFIVLAFARPTLRGSMTGFAGGNARTSAVVVLDNSLSMSRSKEGRTLFFTAKIIANEIADNMVPGDELYLVTPDDTTKDQRSFHDFEMFRQAVERTEMVYHKIDLSAAFIYAQHLLKRSPNINKELYVISDFQQTTFHDSVISVGPERIFAFPLEHGNVTNLSVKQVTLSSTILEKDKMIELEAIVANYNNLDVNGKLALLDVNNEKVAQSTLHVEKNSSPVEKFKFILKNTGMIPGFIQLEDDDLNFDNCRYFTLYVPRQLTVGLVGKTDVDIDYVEMALLPDLSEKYKIEKFYPDNLPYIQIDQLDVLVLSNLSQLSDLFVEKCTDFVANGGGVLLALGANTDIRDYNNGLLKSLGLPQLISTIGSIQSDSAYFSIGKIDFSHPVFSGVFNNESQFSKPQFCFALRSENAADAINIMQYSDGSPFIYEKKFNQGSIIVFTSGFDLKISDFTHKTIFAPLIHQSINYLGTFHTSRTGHLLVGDEIRYKIPSELVEHNLLMQRPDNRSDKIQPEIQSSGPWIYYNDTGDPGFYTLFSNETPLALWAVNIAAEESNLTRVPNSELTARYAMTVISPNMDLKSKISASRFGTELWKHLVFIVVILLIAEMFIYRESGEVSDLNST